METQSLTASIQDLQKKVVETLQETGKLMRRASDLFTIESEKKNIFNFIIKSMRHFQVYKILN